MGYRINMQHFDFLTGLFGSISMAVYDEQCMTEHQVIQRNPKPFGVTTFPEG